ncbi:NAD-dependent epimerase/dehydratase family protein [Lysinibacillus sp. KU-BSD001]|uniref:NAD-dependent epimerase/dehydratase family protein n=1 Tax=Lysinibacillus sp. KU-BSD001 TaxID=3141328 RepID=UPI0036E75F57
MRVLITGGYGFIGSHVAERFYKEGYEVHIIDDLSTGKKENVTIKHKSYILSVDNPKCKDIFASYHFDIVVHLAAQVSVAKSIISPMDDAQHNLVGLTNILHLASQHHVKKFIFASSAAIYGQNAKIPLTEDQLPTPISPYGISKWAGERYCVNWTEQYDLDTICFRFSNVYGPRQTKDGEGGVVSIFTSRILKNQALQIHGDGNQTRDFIYVEDVAFAIYRASQSILSGIYNLSTNTEASVNDIVTFLENAHGTIQTTHIAARKGDIYRSVLSNELIKKQLDWVPMYSLNEGLQKTYEWAKSTVPLEEQVKPVQRREQPKWFKTFKPYIENFIFFCILSAIMLNITTPFLTTFEVGIFYIMTMGAIYGNKQAFFAVALSFSLLLIDKLRQGREFISLMYDTVFFFQLATFLFIGLVVGYSVQRKNIKIEEQNEKIEELENRHQFLEEIHEEVRSVKDELQFRVLNSEDSFGKIYSVIKSLDDLEPEKVLTSTVDVVQKIMRCDGVSIYMFNKYQSFLRLVANSTVNGERPVSNSLKVEDTFYIQQMIHTGQPYMNRHLHADAPLMATPIYHNQQMTAVITISELPFENFSNYHENLFKVVTELISTSLSRAFDYIQMTEETRYIDQTSVLKPEIFNDILASKMIAKEKYNMPFTILKMAVDSSALKYTSDKIVKLLRETDYIGYDNDELQILLSNTSEQDLPAILKRFKEAGIETEIYQGVIV